MGQIIILSEFPELSGMEADFVFSKGKLGSQRLSWVASDGEWFFKWNGEDYVSLLRFLANVGQHIPGNPLVQEKHKENTSKNSTLSIKFAYFLEISYFKLAISCLLNEPKSLSSNPIKQAFPGPKID